jgi:hypothetical protein
MSLMDLQKYIANSKLDSKIVALYCTIARMTYLKIQHNNWLPVLSYYRKHCVLNFGHSIYDSNMEYWSQYIDI